MQPALPIINVKLDGLRGAFKPCMWCGGAVAHFEALRPTDPTFHGARVICDGCGRQIAWASPAQVRQAASDPDRLAQVAVEHRAHFHRADTSRFDA